jgi:regulator of sigma E protease
LEYVFFIPQFGNFLITVAAFIVCLSVIVFVHEFGHYYIGKLSGIHAEVFSIGFGPVLLSLNDKNGTKWQISALPLGGFVKFLGDKNSASSPNIDIKSANDSAVFSRATMQGAPLWARFMTVAAGPLFNFIFSGIIFFVIYMNQGVTKFPLTVEKVFTTPYQQQFKKGDVIRSINGVRIHKNINDLKYLLENSGSEEEFIYTVERNGQKISLENIIQNPPRIGQVLPKSAAITAGLEKGDIILSLNSEKITRFNDIKNFVELSKGEVLKVDFLRDGEIRKTQLKPLIVDVPAEEGGFDRIYRIGIVSDYFPFEPVIQNQSILIALGGAVESIYLIMEGSVNGLYHILLGNISSCNLSGPISIAETSGQMVKQGGINYLWFIAVLSTAIGMINLFPIPVLDGGHLLFFAIEASTGKKPDPSIVNKFMTFGFVLLISLMLFSIFNDFLCP